MSTQKQLPDNLKQLEQKPRFKQVYKQHTVEQLEEKLIEAEVEYGSDENKAALVWRFMDAKGMDFDNQDNDQPARHDEPAEQPQDEKNATNDVPADTPPPVSANDNSAPTGNGSKEEQPTPAAGKQDDKQDDKPAAQYVEVTNNGAYNFYETATGTMIKARQTAKVYTTATIDKAQILRNIEQYNHTRGNKLHVKK